MPLPKEDKKCECGCNGNNKSFDPSKIWDKRCIYHPENVGKEEKKTCVHGHEDCRGDYFHNHTKEYVAAHKEDNLTLKSAVEKCVGVMCARSLQDSYAAPREAFQKILKAYASAQQKEWIEKVKEIVGKHNARILNEYQLMELGDERRLFAPLEKATNETLAVLSDTK